MNRPKFSRFNDGVVFVYREKRKESNFAAKENVSELDDMDFIAKLDYEESSKREQDLEYANANDFSLSLKIHTRLCTGVDNKCKVVINGYLYDVAYVDKTRNDMWLYLEAIKEMKA